jgi:preprotein translocase subunit SecA
MLNEFNRRTISILFRGQIPTRDPEEVRQAHAQQRHDYSRYRTQKDAVARAAAASGQAAAANRDTREQQRPEPLRVEKKPRPNDPCPCGSGKKYKQCHGKMEA